MEDPGETLLVNVNVEIPASALAAIVAHAKAAVGRDEKGHFRVDTAAKVGEMITKFLFERDFESYALDSDNFG